ncbi:MAG TPA: amidase [Xanthobacteraceae bacterium]|jgi:aspartyl-tRNA(Asn)/glutamyl-tRNA(Gln) amidotransferase subunit A
MSSAPPYGSLAAAAAAIKSRAVSPVELAQIYLDRIAELQPRFHAFITVTGERALADARAAELAMAAGDWRGPLHGIPIALKDVIETKGIRTTAHSRALADHVPQSDAAVARALVKAGAVLLGKLATHEFAVGGPSWDLPWPPARSPWNSEHFTGGSSSGAAAALAAGLALGAIGSDTSGSVRSPAAFCGITGFKPTFNAIDPQGVLPVAPSMDTVGLLAWTVEDCRLLYDAVGSPALDAEALRASALASGSDIRGMRIKVIRHFFTDDAPISCENQRAIERALDVFRGLGCTVLEGRLPPLQEWMACGLVILLAEAWAKHGMQIKARPDLYGAAFRGVVSLGSALAAADKRAAERKRGELCGAMRALMDDCDLLISAVQVGTAPKLKDVSPWAAFSRPSHAMPFSVTGQPAISICCGYGENGLPLGFQLVAARSNDWQLLLAGMAYEEATGWHERRPACWQNAPEKTAQAAMAG